jgi:hypothetical protein
VTQNTFAGNGTTGPFNFTFEYIDETDVRVSIDGTTQATTAYTFPTASTLQFVSLTPTAQQTIRIFRETDVDSLKATFFAGSSIRSQDLNNNFEQNNFAVQEIKEQYVTEENGEFTTNVDMNSNRITDMADPVNAQDAVTKQYLEDNYFDDGTETILAAETWPDNDTTIATTAAIDNRVDSKIDTAMENDVLVNNTGLTKSATGGQVTLGIAANSVDLDRIKDSDKITLSEQESDNDQVGTDDQIFTAQAATRRFNNYYQNDAPTATDGIGVGQVWVDPNDDLTLSVWTGSAWSAITSGGTFSNQPKVVYVDAGSGDDSNDGHRISRPKKTIRAALSDINSDSNGDGSIISVAPGIYAETLPLDIEKNDVGIIGQSLRTCIIHPLIPEADRDAYDVDSPHSQELQTMFRVNSGSYFQNLTLTGLKASGTRGASGSLYTDSTHGLPPNQGWNFAFFPNATIKKSPYIQNCTNFSDSQINNVPANFSPHIPGEGAAGDLDSAPTGGGILVDGSVPATASPLRSMVADSYTHTALDGPGILVTNNGYAQCTSSYAFFNHAHITCLNGGQANLAASTTDFGRFALVADGKSPTAIFTSNVDGAAADWFGDATRPANNMLVTVNSVTYPVLSAVPRTDSEGGAGFTVTISRPDTSDRSVNKGLNGAVSDNAAVSFFLRSMIASSGHTMEYVGSGTDYNALPENGGVPNDSNQIIEKNDGKIWTATTDHKGTFKVGDFFTVDQSAGTLSVDSGSFKVDLGTLNLNNAGDAVVGADIDMGSNEITSSSGDLELNATGSIDVNSNKIIGLAAPTLATDAATKAYVDANTFGAVSEDTAPTLGGNLNVSTHEIISSDNRDITIDPNGTGDIVLEAKVGIGTNSPSQNLHIFEATDDDVGIRIQNNDGFAELEVDADELNYNADSHVFNNQADDAERMRINASGNVGIGATAPDQRLHVTTSAVDVVKIESTSNGNGPNLTFRHSGTEPGDDDVVGKLTFEATNDNSEVLTFADIEAISTDVSDGAEDGALAFSTRSGTALDERLRITNDGHVGIGTTTPDGTLHVHSGTAGDVTANVGGDDLVVENNGDVGISLLTADGNNTSNVFFGNATDSVGARISWNDSTDNNAGEMQIGTANAGATLRFNTADEQRRMTIDAAGNVMIGTPTAAANTQFTVRAASPHISLLGTPGTNTSQINFGDTDDHDICNISYTQTDNRLHFTVNAVERVQIDDNGRLLVGHTTSRDVANVAQPSIQIEGTNVSTSTASIVRNQADANGPILALSKSRGTATGANTIVQENDITGAIHFAAADGTDLNSFTAWIQSEVDGEPGGNDMPGRLTFHTTADDAAAPTERMRIHSTGTVSFANGIELGSALDDTAANTLDDYEEGTWTPAPAFGGETDNVAGTFQGNYTKIGRLVTVFCALQFTSNGDGTGGNTVGGLPFEVADTFTANNNAVGAEFSGSVGFFANGGDRERATYGVLALSGTNNVQFIGGSNSNHADLDVVLGENTIVDNSSIRFTLQYLTTA